MGKIGRIILILGAIITAITCCYSGYLLILSNIPWVQIPTPSEGIESLSLGDAGELLAQTEDGNLYEFSVYSQREWQKVDAPSGQPPAGRDCVPTSKQNMAPNPPAKAVYRISEQCFHAETAYQFELAYLENGEMWYWEKSSYAYTVLANIAVILSGFSIGIFIMLIGGVVMLIQRWRIRA